MPRVTLIPPTPEQKRLRRAETIIRRGMAERELRTQNELADKLHMSPTTLSDKLRRGGWRDNELARLASILRLSAEDVAGILGVK